MLSDQHDDETPVSREQLDAAFARIVKAFARRTHQGKAEAVEAVESATFGDWFDDADTIAACLYELVRENMALRGGFVLMLLCAHCGVATDADVQILDDGATLTCRECHGATTVRFTTGEAISGTPQEKESQDG